MPDKQKRRYMAETLSMPGVEMSEPRQSDDYISRTLSMPGASPRIRTSRPAQTTEQHGGSRPIRRSGEHLGVTYTAVIKNEGIERWLIDSDTVPPGWNADRVDEAVKDRNSRLRRQ